MLARKKKHGGIDRCRHRAWITEPSGNQTSLKQNMSKQLSIIPAVEKSVVPKPTKTEILQALVSVAMKNQGEEIRFAAEKKQKLKTRAEEAIRKHYVKICKSTAPTIHLGYLGSSSEKPWDCYAKIEFDSLPDDVNKVVLEYHKFKVPGRLSEAEMRRKIKDSLAGATPRSERVSTMLNSPESVKALEEMLSVMGICSKPLEA
jgi:hypothetical protein